MLLQGTLAEGCTCINLDPDNALENDYNYNYAVYGDVVGIDTATDYYGNDYLSYKVKVVGIYKKSRGIRAGGVIEICSWIGASACGVTLNKGERYILFYRK